MNVGRGDPIPASVACTNHCGAHPALELSEFWLPTAALECSCAEVVLMWPHRVLWQRSLSLVRGVESNIIAEAHTGHRVQLVGVTRKARSHGMGTDHIVSVSFKSTNPAVDVEA